MASGWQRLSDDARRQDTFAVDDRELTAVAAIERREWRADAEAFRRAFLVAHAAPTIADPE